MIPVTVGFSTKHRLTFIDALRAVAILLVFARHSAEVFVHYGYGTREILKVTSRFDFGELGVVIFFAISGFLIPSSLHGARLGGSVRYVLSRAFRLYPAFLVSVIPSAFTHFWLNGKSFTDSDLWLNATMVPRLFGAPLANGAYWTLEVEIAFYLLCLVLFVGGLVEQTFVFAAIALVLFVLFESSQQVLFYGVLNPDLSGYAFFFCLNLSVMCWGAMCRNWWGGRRLNIATAIVFWGFGAFWIGYRPALLVAAVLRDRLADVDTNITVSYGLSLALFLAAALHGRIGLPLLLWIGRISYSFYLLHGVAIHLIQHELERHPTLQGYYAGYYSVLAFAMSLAMAHASFRYIEQPGIRLGRRLIDASLRRLDALPGAPAWLTRVASPLLARPPVAARQVRPAPQGATDSVA